MNFISSLRKPAALLTGILALLVGAAFSARGTLAAPPTCNGFTATIYVENGVIVGGSQNGQTYTGVLTGSSGNDVIVGSTGNDTVNAQDGDDVICAGAGNDTVNGGAGTDWISGGEGSDFCDQADTSQECEALSTQAVLVVKVNAVPDDGQDFAFTAGALGNFSLDDDTDSALANMKTFSNVTAGTYVLAQTPVANWTPSLSCDSSVSGDLSAIKATLNLKAGTVTTCTFTNTKTDTAPQCNDGKDNDADGLVDLKDPGCADVNDTNEKDATPTVTQCNDGKDNDNDGLVDEDDKGCWTNQSNSSTYNPKDNSEQNSGVSCPNPEDPINFGVRAGVMARIQVVNPDLYAKLVTIIKARNAQLAKLCVLHPDLYEKIMARRAQVLQKLEDKRKIREERKEEKEERKAERKNDDDDDDDEDENEKGGNRASLQGNVQAGLNLWVDDDDEDRDEDQLKLNADSDATLRVWNKGKGKGLMKWE